MMMNRTPISYYGGKQGMQKKILPLIPKHRVYVEPFFGGGTIFFAKGPSYLEVINDINDNVVNFFEVMQKDFDRLKVEVQCSMMSEAQHKKALKIYKNPADWDPLERAWAFWYVTNFSFANKPGGGWKFDAGTANSHAGRQVKRRRDQFKYYKDRLSEVQISCRDAIRVINDRDSEDTFFYLDPPYPCSDQGHYKGYTEKDLKNLLFTITTIKGKFMLSNYMSDTLKCFIAAHKWQVKEYDMRLSAPRAKGQRKREILVMNYEPENILFK
jgi:DNA adenine methylase